MPRQLRKVLIVSAALGSSMWAREPDTTIAVLVYNYASLQPKELAQTERGAATIYERAGIAIEWLDCPLSSKEAALYPACPIQPGPDNLITRFLPQALAERLPRVQDRFGFAMLADDGGFAMTANVFTDTVLNIGSDRETVLGAVVAHELGHLLLGAHSHSQTGVMRSHWYHGELRTIAQHALSFTPGQAEQLRANIRSRKRRALTAGQR